MRDARQENIDSFYWKTGKCCAGCDWWRSLNTRAGECTRSRPTGRDRFGMLGITGSSLKVGAGHVMTPRDHQCGDFKDEFDWSALPLPYLARIGYKRPSPDPQP